MDWQQKILRETSQRFLIGQKHPIISNRIAIQRTLPQRAVPPSTKRKGNSGLSPLRRELKD